MPGYTNCTVITQDPSPPLSFTAYPDNNACDEVVLRINGGDAPFTVSVLAGQSGQYANVTNHNSRRVNLRNTVAAGQTFHSQSPRTRPFRCSSTDVLTGLVQFS